MQIASTQLRNALNSGHSIKALPKVIAEWNQNRYAGIQKVDTVPSQDTTQNDIDVWPIESIVEANRPKRGIIKGRCSPDYTSGFNRWSRQAQRTVKYGDEGFTSEDYSDKPDGTGRYYTVGREAAYKYWSSPNATTTSSASVGFAFPGNQEHVIEVIYKADAWANKIVIGFENSWASPAAFNVDITTDGTSWVSIATNPTLNAEGQVVLYRQTTGAWTSAIFREGQQKIRGVRLRVRGLTKANSYLNLIEVSARLESDLTQWVTNWNCDFTQSEANFITPLGTASANVGSVELSNLDGRFNNDSPTSIYTGLMRRNAKIVLDLVYDVSAFGGSPTETIRQFTMWVDDWEGDGSETVTASVKDSSMYLMETKVPDIFLENITVGEAIWRICDSVGFNNFVYDARDVDTATTIPYFWATGDDTVWETFSKLAEATQTAVYFDEYDVLMIQTKTAAYDKARAIDWSLQSVNNSTSGGKLPDIVSLNKQFDFEANTVNIKYKETNVSEFQNGNPVMETIWEPDNDFVLRSSPLNSAMTTTSTSFYVTQADASTWPYEGFVQIGGEIIRYKGKYYIYYDKNSSTQGTWVYSQEDKNRIDKKLSSESMSWRNTFTGQFKIEKRGDLWTSPRNHEVNINNWSGSYGEANGGFSNYQGGISHDRTRSVIRLTGPAGGDLRRMYVAARGNISDQSYGQYGTRMYIPQVAQGVGSGGICWNIGSGNSGYFLDVTRSEVLDQNGGERRNFQHEINFIIRRSDGTLIRRSKGTPFSIGKGLWYDIDVRTEISGANHIVVVYINGVAMIRAIVAAVDTVTPTGRFGVYTRGTSTYDFDYMYCIYRPTIDTSRDDVSNYDAVRGGFNGGQWDREYIFSTREMTRKSGSGKYTTTYKQNYNQYFFDDFGPYVHEVRNMKVDFEKFPVLHSRIYCNNMANVAIPEYNGNAFGAEFLLANASRKNAILKGEESTPDGTSKTQFLLIYGRVVTEGEEKTITASATANSETDPREYKVTNEDEVRKSGVVEVDIDNRWIQSKGAAISLGGWILDNWAGGCDEIEVEMFGNPIIQLADLVSVWYPEKNMLPASHKYFVVGVNKSWNNGLETKLTLRRAKI